MKTRLFLATFFLLTLQLIAQQKKDLCGSDKVNKEMMDKYPEFKRKWDDFNLKLATKKVTGKIVGSGSDIVYEIPIVVHVMNDGGAIGTQYNKSDADIIAWINNTNAIYEGTAPGYNGPGTGGTKIPIRFVLAKRDPNCNPTTGIIRVNAAATYPDYFLNGLKYNSQTTTTTESMLKSLSRWNPKYYYNIYVVNKLDGNDGSGGGVLGYSYFPGGPDSNDNAFMLSNTVNTTSWVMAHEMGHAMGGLLHTFDGADSNGNACASNTGNCLMDNDKVCDTEYSPSAINLYPCPTDTTINICTSAPYQGVQSNIMNYGYCHDRFTDGQRDRAVAQILEFRKNLINSITADPITSVDPVVNNACIPSASTLAGNGYYDVGPRNINFNTINYQSGGYNADDNKYYIDHTNETCLSSAISTSIETGKAVSLSVSIAINPQYVKAFIDYNNNGVFDLPAELIMDTNISVAAGTGSVSVTAPATAVLNTPLRMRIMADFYFAISSSCSTLYFGQTEDFRVTIIPPCTPVTPTFTQVNAICTGGTLSALPTSSNNGFSGTWSPALNNTATTTYTFTPTAGECANTATMTITVNQKTTPTFAQVNAICSGATLSTLPTTSNNGSTGTWSPALNNTATTTYAFTPTAGQCANTATMTITVNQKVAPTFTQVNAICSGATLSALPTTSNNSITGTWSPALNNTATTTYTFTPTAGQCANTAMMTTTVTTSTYVPVAITPVWGKQAGACAGTTLSLTCAAGKTKGNVRMEYAYFDGNVAPANDSSEWKLLGLVQSGSLTATNGAITRTMIADAGKIWFRTVASYSQPCLVTVYSAAAGLAVNSGVTAGNANVSHSGVVCAGVTGVARLSLPTADLGARIVGSVVTTWYKSTIYTGSNFANAKWTVAGVGTGADCGLDVPALTATTWYYANIVNGSCNSQSANIVKVTVTPTAVAGKIVAGKTVCKDDSIMLTASPVKRTGNHFKWEVSTDQTNWNVIGGDTDSATVGAAYTTTAGARFSVRYTISSTDTVNESCSSSVSSAAVVTVDFPTVPGSAFGGGLVCASDATHTYLVPAVQGKLTVKGNTGKTFQWQYSTAGESTGFVNVPASLGGLPFTSSSAKSTTNSYIVTTVTQDIWFRCMVSNGACGFLPTGAVKFDTGERPELSGISSSVASGDVCNGVTAYLTADGFTGSSIKWQLSINGGSFTDIIGATKTAYTAKLANTTATPVSMTYKAKALIGDCDFVDKTITFLVYPTAKTTAITGNLLTGTRDGSTAAKAICLSGPNALAKTLILGPGYGGNIEWQTLVTATTPSPTAPVGSWVTCAGTTNQSTYTVIAPVAGLNTFRVKLASGPCTTAYTASIKVYYDATCSAARTMVEETAVAPFAITAYPNPYSETFRLNVATTSDARVEFMVYDMIGRLLDQREVTPNQLSELQIGNRYPTGVYNIIVNQGEEVKTLRVIKK